MAIRLIIPKGCTLKKKVRDFYITNYFNFKRENPDDREYTRTKLRNNISSVLSITRQTFENTALQPPKYNPWMTSGTYEVSFSHWFFAVRLKKSKNGSIIGVIIDGHHESEHHNDTMDTKPYESRTQSKWMGVYNLMERIERVSKW